MTDRETLYSGLSNAAWGYFFLHIHFNLGTINILPAFVGYLLLLSAIRKLSGERRDLLLLQPLGGLLAAWNLADWLFACLGGELSGMFLPLDLLAAVAGLYFHFQFITDMAALAEAYQPEGGSLARRLRQNRTAYIVVCTATSVFLRLPIRDEDVRLCVGMGLLVVMLVVVLLIMGELFALRRLFREPGEQQPEV